MSRLLKRVVSGLCVLGLSAFCVQPARAALNNGFNPDHIYALKTPDKGGQLRELGEVDGAVVVDNLWPVGAELGWQSLTFSGVGVSDARLFVAKEVDADSNGTPDDIRIIEIDSAANTVNSALLSTIAGASVGTSITFGDIRFSKSYPDSLFVGARSDVSGQSRGMAWEINLALTTLKNTYTGPTMPPPDANDSSLRPVMIAINDATQKLYMTGRHLGEPTCTGNGDLVELDLTGGSTSTYTTLIDGPTYQAGDPTWTKPQCLIFRSSNPTDGTPTILVGPANSNWQLVFEFYLDTTAHPKDSNNNLQRRGAPVEAKFPGKGQEDEVTHSIWLTGFTGGVYELASGDAVRELMTNLWYVDVDSPYGVSCPTIRPVTPDPKDVFTDIEYVEQLVLTSGEPPITWTLLQGPDGAQIDQTGRVYGWTPTVNDIGQLFTFEAVATNAACPDNPNTEVWSVRVFDAQVVCNGFRRDWVYLCRQPGEGGNIRVFYEDYDPLVVAVDDFQPDDTNWRSITFAGCGDNDCRLFGIRGDPLFPATATDILMAEFDSAGNILKQVKLGSIAPGYGANNVGPDVEPWNIRYSKFHNSLFIGVNQDKNNSTPAIVVEVDLELTTILNAYQGPNIVDGGVAIDINSRDDTLYVTNPNMNGSVGKGDLIAFDTSGGSTSSYVSLINGDSLGDSFWNAPGGLVYRDRLSNPTNRPTILVLMTGSPELTPVLEYYLDAVDGNGNLVKRGQPISLLEPWGAQMDESSNTIWFAPRGGGGSVNGLRRDDTVYQPDDPNNWTKPWVDVDSPPGKVTQPPCSPLVFADADEDGDVDMMDFGVLQTCLTFGGGTIPSSPAYCECFDRNGDHDIDTWDMFEFIACGTGPATPFDPDHAPADCNP